jgi:hypothetical protein
MLPAAYQTWIEGRRAQQREDPSLGQWEALAEEAVAGCVKAAHRITEGIDLLERDPVAMEAFRFANAAMALQRVHTLLSQSVRRGEARSLEEHDTPANRSWRLFQLGFILLNLPSLANFSDEDRQAGPDAGADLLWFPTGGGKTEAYLGLTAYVLAIRRLQGAVEGRSGEHGVAVLMRYTLRLLTLQQFQRAATLMCACEMVRREAAERGDPRWEREPFRVGLWVGSRATPNTTADSAEAVRREHGSYRRTSNIGGSGSPDQLTNCPWCGSAINGGRDIVVEEYAQGRGRTLIFCGDTLGTCPFSRRQSPQEGLPVLLVDEEIYRRLPALLISTVDKFAQMPWRGETEMLFGQVNGFCERHGFRSPDLQDKDSHPARGGLARAQTIATSLLRPPDLIIQDELHLISGPLGTMVGLYETAVDTLSTWIVDGRPVRPKVIASTATVKQAQPQVHGLFLRRVEVFPPPGLDIEDNFFSRQIPPSPEHPGRRYLGVCAPGRRVKAALIRVYVALLASSQSLYESYGGRPRRSLDDTRGLLQLDAGAGRHASAHRG